MKRCGLAVGYGSGKRDRPDALFVERGSAFHLLGLPTRMGIKEFLTRLHLESASGMNGPVILISGSRKGTIVEESTDSPVFGGHFEIGGLSSDEVMTIQSSLAGPNVIVAKPEFVELMCAFDVLQGFQIPDIAVRCPLVLTADIALGFKSSTSETTFSAYGDAEYDRIYDAVRAARDHIKEVRDGGHQYAADISVLCKKDEALVLDAHDRILAVFQRKGGLYVAKMKVRNPKYKAPFGGQAR